MKTEIFGMEERADDFRHYRPIPFWSWNNKLDGKELVRQIGLMKEAGLGGFIMHARTGLITEYLSEEWFDCIRVCLDEAKRLGMDAWVYDENGWPSGFVGGKLLENPDNFALYLSYEVKSEFDGEALCVFVPDEAGFRRVRAGEKGGEFHTVYQHSSPSNTDILNPDVVTQFIDMTYEPYYARFADRFGAEFAGFFTDEPQYFRYATPFTKVAPKAFAEKYPGEDILDGLVWLFVNDPRGYAFRQKYYKLFNELYTINFYKRLYDWCTEHGTQFTGHSVEECSLYPQMWGGAGVMPSYEYETVPGIDFLGRCQISPLGFKQIGSACAQLEKPRILTETFGCSGWDANPRELKFLAECQFVCGVNLMCQHLMDYSMKGQGKLDHPPSFSHHTPWWEDFKCFNDYFGHLGNLIANTTDCAKTVVLHPLRSIYLDYIRLDESKVGNFDEEIVKLMDALNAHHIDYHFADETLLARHGSVSNGKLRIGACQYDSVVIPHTATVDARTKELLEAYAAQGGRVLVYDELPKLVDGKPAELDVAANLTFEELERRSLPDYLKIDGTLQYTLRKGRGFEFVYLLNSSQSPADVTLSEAFELVDLVTMERRPAPAHIHLERTDSVALVRDAGDRNPVSANETEVFGTCSEITGDFKYVSSTPNTLALDFIQISRNGEPFGSPRFVYEVKDSLIREDFKGNLRAKYTFFVDDLLPLTLRCEREKWLSVRCNGGDVKLSESDFDMNFLDADLTPLLRAGENELVFEVYYVQSPVVRYALFDPEATESLRNCLVYDTEVESVFLHGDFSLTEELHVAAPTRRPALSRIDEQGFKMFAGVMVFEGEVFFETETAEFSADGRFMTVDFEVDGRPAGGMVLDNVLRVTAEAGKSHRVRLTVRSSLRNSFGPFHFGDPEPLGVSPACFTMLGQWKDGKCDWFFPGYHTVPFGVDRLTVRFRRGE